MARPAVPAKVHLRMRFLKADGNPLADTSYRVRWGSEQAPPTPVAQTTSDGWVDEVLSGNFPHGWVEFGEFANPAIPDAKTFVPRLRIEVVLVKPPGPPSKHKGPSQKSDAPGTRKGKADSTGNSSSSSPTPDPDEEPPEPTPPLPAPGNLISSPVPNKAPLDFDPEGRSHATKVHQKKKYSTAIPPEEVERLHRLPLDEEEAAAHYAARKHAMQVRVFNLAWRLHNLGFLGLWSGYLTFPIDWGVYADILDALNRYAYKHGLARVKEKYLFAERFEPSSLNDPLAEIWDHLEQTHDGF